MDFCVQKLLTKQREKFRDFFCEYVYYLFVSDNIVDNCFSVLLFVIIYFLSLDVFVRLYFGEENSWWLALRYPQKS